ncbi:MAG: BolA family transcriptional regulator [Rhodocyclaceae bacterium]|jgi:BolA protein|nr:BolA family transcriptional regulator [Rhodocyclaceae bacterium]MBK6906826.1 BolA family transcriptional regulator [Rhodocyclaceae bacterium]
MTLDDTIRERLSALNPEQVELIDESHKHAGHAGAQAGGKHFELTIIARCFNDLPTLARHRLVYDSLGSLMHKEIHALRIIALPYNSPTTIHQEHP